MSCLGQAQESGGRPSIATHTMIIRQTGMGAESMPTIHRVMDSRPQRVFLFHQTPSWCLSASVVSDNLVAYCCAISWFWRGATKESRVRGMTEERRSQNQKGAQLEGRQVFCLGT